MVGARHGRAASLILSEGIGPHLMLDTMKPHLQPPLPLPLPLPHRLLDDNRELFVPELQEVVRPHPHFLLFATQNPPGLYAGRKVLSRAFRSRFLELHVEDLPDTELAEILEKRCV